MEPIHERIEDFLRRYGYEGIATLLYEGVWRSRVDELALGKEVVL